MRAGLIRKCCQINLSVMRYHQIARFEKIQWGVVEVNCADDARAIALEMLS